MGKFELCGPVKSERDAIFSMVRALRTNALLLTSDEIVAERLVDMTVETAITNIGSRRARQPLNEWLHSIMLALIHREATEYLH